MPTIRHFAIIVSVILLRSGSSLPAAEPPSTEFTRPELIAIAWASPHVQAPADAPVGNAFTAWRPDGSLIPSDEVASIRKDLREFGALGKVEPDRLPPLHLVFRIDVRAKNSQRLAPSLMLKGRPVESLAVQEGSSGNHLALSNLSLARGPIAHWPAEIDVAIRVPIEDGDVFKKLNQLHDAPASFAAGTQLSWTKVATMGRAGQKFSPAIALATDRQQTALVDYDFFTHLKDGSAHSFNALQSNDTHDLRVSPPLESKEDLDHIDLWRLRYRTELYDRLPVFPERIPK